MRPLTVALACVLGLSTLPIVGQTPSDKSYRLETLAWPEAERVLTPEAVVVVPLGAASKEHGPHLKLRNDLSIAEYLTGRVAEATAVVVAPTLTYHFYPAFLEYPGSTSLSLTTARDMTTEVVRTLSAYGPRRFYILNTGVSTVRPLQAAVATLASEGILVRFTDLAVRLDPATRGLTEQAGGTHADEVETSMMLYIDEASVDVTKAVRDYTPSSGSGALTRKRGAEGTYSPSGIWGDPTRATRDKGRVFVEALTKGILDDIAALRTASLPAKSAAGEPARANATSIPTPDLSASDPPEKCSAGDERAIVSLGFAFSLHWSNADARSLGMLWTKGGDMIHPDGSVERTAQVITMNRTQLFLRPEYRRTRHPLTLNMVRCLAADVAIADGKWELRGLRDGAGKELPMMEGQVTMVLKREGGWRIDAYRYTLKPTPGLTAAPQARPGGPGPG